MTLDFLEIEDHKDLLPHNVYEQIRKYDLDGKAKVARIDPQYADGESLNRIYGIPYEKELNCLIIEGKRNDIIRYAALVLPYGKKANMNAKVRKPLDVKDVKFADLDYVIRTTGMEYGAITPLGLPDDWLILVDDSVFDQEYVIIGGGYAISKLMIPSKLFKDMENCMIIDGLAKQDQ